MKEMGVVVEAMQVCWQLTEENKQRELAGLEEVLSIHKRAKAYIVTFNQEGKEEGIPIVPAWKWLTM